MQHHHHIDEFSVTDVRHTLQEMGRVLMARKWFFLFPFCIVSSIACICSLYAPRQYSASTVIKREHDPVFASLRRKNWNKAYDDVRARMSADLTDPAFVRKVLDRANLPVGAERFGDGTMSPGGDATRNSLAMQIASGLSVKMLEASESRDVMRITLTLADHSRIPEILKLLRESYMEHARVETIAVMENVHQFLKAEASRCEADIARIGGRVREMEAKYPGVDPLAIDPLAAERTALIVERIDLRRRLDDLTARRSQLEGRMVAARGSAESESAQAPRMIEEPNPRYAELLNELKGLEEKLIACRTRKGMTEAHPEVRAARAMMEERGLELAQTQRLILTPEKSASGADSQKSLGELERELAETLENAALLKSRSEAVETRLAEVEALRILSVEQRTPFMELSEQKRRLEAGLADWRGEIAPIENALYLEGSGRSIHFATVEEPGSAMKPVSPDALLVLAICFGIGLGTAVLTVVTVELCDRSYRTVKQVTTSLGLPLIESIDEIVTPLAFRRRLVRGMLVTPILGFIFVVMVSLSGLMAYYSLERPEDYARMRGRATHVSELFARQG
ncbi:MAG TPA: hypothetical protein VNT79_01460 [Phycisphaerae bacterium]|nr:hypothetical protein [Phycisphaerae bacterium]